ncbi:integrase, catalytic region, zinc finger, CCHC-type containing protein [Tanacetum coccineum]|uniref:Integrase, catalytic region, zinc finger, CCHC-type containing protein n=1 Tax=Tanacetum coccineum TaxID=301880 RepID=A0ABQ5I143_9ASTR
MFRAQLIKFRKKLFANVGYQWKPTRRKFPLGEQCPLTRFTKSKVVPLMQPEHISSSKFVITERFNNTSQKPLTRYKRKNKQEKALSNGIPTTTETQSIDDSLLLKTYDGESLTAQEFHEKVHQDRKFCDSDLEVAFKKHMCYVRNKNGVDLLKGSRGSNLYTISVEDMMKSSLICLLSKASKNKSWLWHHRLNHLNFGTINDLTRKYLNPQVLKDCKSFTVILHSTTLISHQGVAAGPTIKDNPFAQAKDNPFVNVFAPEPSSEESSSGDVIKPKNVKTVMDEACWFEAIQEEIHEFDQL